VSVTRLSGRKARIDVSLDGVTFTRSESEAIRRGLARRTHVDWDDVTGAEIRISGKGRAIVRVSVAGQDAVPRPRDDPHALKVPRKQAGTAHLLVEQINGEVAARRLWSRHAREDGHGPTNAS
jgi:hypothetical protein